MRRPRRLPRRPPADLHGQAPAHVRKRPPAAAAAAAGVEADIRKRRAADFAAPFAEPPRPSAASCSQGKTKGACGQHSQQQSTQHAIRRNSGFVITCEGMEVCYGSRTELASPRAPHAERTCVSCVWALTHRRSATAQLALGACSVEPAALVRAPAGTPAQAPAVSRYRQREEEEEVE